MIHCFIVVFFVAVLPAKSSTIVVFTVMSEKSYDPDSASAESFDADDLSSKGLAASVVSEKSYDPDAESVESFDAE